MPGVVCVYVPQDLNNQGFRGNTDFMKHPRQGDETLLHFEMIDRHLIGKVVKLLKRHIKSLRVAGASQRKRKASVDGQEVPAGAFHVIRREIIEYERDNVPRASLLRLPPVSR